MAPRPENSRPLPTMLEGRCRLLHMDDYNISSSEIRARIGRGKNMDVWLPSPVAAMIRDKGLYHADSQNAAI